MIQRNLLILTEFVSQLPHNLLPEAVYVMFWDKNLKSEIPNLTSVQYAIGLIVKNLLFHRQDTQSIFIII